VVAHASLRGTAARSLARPLASADLSSSCAMRRDDPATLARNAEGLGIAHIPGMGDALTGGIVLALSGAARVLVFWWHLWH